MHFLSHTGQDRWVCEVLRYKTSGYFLDFGGFDGLMHSNTFYLEKFLGWKGIMVEPNPQPYSSACAVRSCITVNYALWSESRRSLEFTNSHGLSSIKDFIGTDSNAELRKKISRGFIQVDTINPTELLKRFSAPKLIDYMSLDVEGAELEVLKAIDLDQFNIALMSIEHNHNTEKKSNIRKHLAKFGYIPIEHRNDDFFYQPDLLKSVSGGDFTQPESAQEKVINNYRLIEY